MYPNMEPRCGSAATELHRQREGRDSPMKKQGGRRGKVGWAKQKMPLNSEADDGNSIGPIWGKRAVLSQGLQSRSEQPNRPEDGSASAVRTSWSQALALSEPFLLSTSVFPGSAS